VVKSAAPSSSTGLFGEIDRRSLLGTGAAAATSLAQVWSIQIPLPAFAAETTKVVVAGATGQTGRRVLERLAGKPGLAVIGGVRNVDAAQKTLAESSTVIRGAMVQQVASVDTSAVELKHLDVVKDSVSDLAATLQGADAMIIATGFIPGNPFEMNSAAHAVDNVGTCKLVDAAKAAGIKKIVMVSSILTNGRNWGQEKSPGFVVTNAFGNVLDEKIVAENYLRSSGIDYTIVRPGGLKAKPPTGALKISGEDTLNSGEVSRDLVADVCIAALTDKKASNKVLEIIEDEGTEPKVFNGLSM
jgi:nucleoside-diphosphate-sugar epimerase